jgi:PAS domain S-box-containing protein
MQLVYIFYVLILGIVALAAALMLIYAQRFWHMAAARPFAFTMACVGWWALFAGWSAVAPSEEAALSLGVPLRFTGVILTPVASVLFALAYTDRTKWLSFRRAGLLFIVPIISLLIAWTYMYHNFFVYDVVYEQLGSIWLRTAWSQGIWFQLVHVPYSSLLVLITVALYLHQVRHVRYPYQQQAYLLLAGTFFPIVTGALATFDMLPGPDLDLTVFGFSVTGFMFAWALSRYQLLDFAPIARSTIIDTMADAIMVLDNDDRVVEMNPAFYTRMGLTRRQAVGLKLEEIFSRWPEMIQRYEGFEEGQMVVTVPGGDRNFHLDIQVSRIHDGRGRPIGRLVVWRDITVLKETELALEASLKRVALLLQAAGSLSDFTRLEDLFQTTVERVAWTLPADRVLLIVFDQEKKEITDFVAGGPGAEAVPSLPYSELMAGLSGWVLAEWKPALSLKGEPDLRESAAVRQRRLETNCGSIIVVPILYREQVLGTMTVINRPDERDFNWGDVEMVQALASQTAVAIENSRLYIAQREQLQALQESNEALEAFSYMVAHDLKGPLGVITSYSELVLTVDDESKISRKRMSRYFEAIFRTSVKMSGIINDLLLLARVRREEDLPLEPIEMNMVVTEVLARLNRQIEEQAARVERPRNWPRAVGYAPWVEEIWTNYISNALKYGGECPQIVLGFEETGLFSNGPVRFWVQDNGVGMTAEDQAQLFREFSRVGERNIQGHGLGLSIVRRIAERMGGEVGVESEAGVGSVFYFTLPKG